MSTFLASLQQESQQFSLVRISLPFMSPVSNCPSTGTFTLLVDSKPHLLCLDLSSVSLFHATELNSIAITSNITTLTHVRIVYLSQLRPLSKLCWWRQEGFLLGPSGSNDLGWFRQALWGWGSRIQSLDTPTREEAIPPSHLQPPSSLLPTVRL